MYENWQEEWKFRSKVAIRSTVKTAENFISKNQHKYPPPWQLKIGIHPKDGIVVYFDAKRKYAVLVDGEFARVGVKPTPESEEYNLWQDADVVVGYYIADNSAKAIEQAALETGLSGEQLHAILLSEGVVGSE